MAGDVSRAADFIDQGHGIGHDRPEAVRKPRPWPGAGGVTALVQRERPEPCLVQVRCHVAPRARALRKSVQEDGGCPVDWTGVDDVKGQVVPTKPLDTFRSHAPEPMS